MRFLYLFFVYSFVGWVFETVLVALKKKRLVNRGYLNGPVCMTYGITAVVLTMSLTSLTDRPVFLFVGSAIYATVVELIAGKLLEMLFHERWWDYHNKRWNFDGYVCLSHSLFWGALGLVVVKWVNPLLLRLYDLPPKILMHTVLWVLFAVLVADILGTTALLAGKKEQAAHYAPSNRKLYQIRSGLQARIGALVERRISRAYEVSAQPVEKAEKEGVFAQGCGFYKLFWLFFVGAFIGDLVETVFCRFALGEWMSRSSLVWGPFSIVWGLGIAIFTGVLYQHRNRSDAMLFLIGTLVGGAFEYLCSVFTELVFGTIFWDYSNVPFNLGGRINLLYCFFWGIVAVVWFRFVYGKISGLIERIPMRVGKPLTWVLVVFMAVNMLVSSLALGRYQERRSGVEATKAWQKVMDKYFDDERMKRIYPKAKGLEKRGVPAES